MKRVEQIYQDRLKSDLERTHRDDFVAIEPDSGAYFLGRTLSEAAAAARAAYSNRRTGVLRVGHPATLYLGASPQFRSLIHDVVQSRVFLSK
jgi:hypothetical protein